MIYFWEVHLHGVSGRNDCWRAIGLSWVDEWNESPRKLISPFSGHNRDRLQLECPKGSLPIPFNKAPGMDSASSVTPLQLRVLWFYSHSYVSSWLNPATYHTASPWGWTSLKNTCSANFPELKQLQKLPTRKINILFFLQLFSSKINRTFFFVFCSTFFFKGTFPDFNLQNYWTNDLSFTEDFDFSLGWSWNGFNVE